MGRIEKIRSTNPKLLEGENKQMVSVWRQRLDDKEKRKLNHEGAILFTYNDEIVDHVCLRGLRFKAESEEELERMREELARRVIAEGKMWQLGGDWKVLWLEPRRNSAGGGSYRYKFWDTKASSREDSNIQRVGGYTKSKYRHSKHRQSVSDYLKRTERYKNNQFRKKWKKDK